MKSRTALSFLCGAALLCTGTDAVAEVFSLWSFTGKKQSVSTPPEDLLKAGKLWTEKIRANGQTLSLAISMVDLPFQDCVRQLRTTYPGAAFAGNRESMLMEKKDSTGRRQRVFLLSVRGIHPVLQFSIELPDGKSAEPEWPGEFPLPGGAKPITVMEFPERKALYGMFSSRDSIQNVFPQLNAELRAAGWKPVSGESMQTTRGTGEIYLKNGRLLIIGFSSDSRGGCTGTMYRRPSE